MSDNNKVFISWSGKQSERLGEELRIWLPNVLQLVKPYFTPSDIEKGSRWQNEVASNLESSNYGILCVTRENINSDWLLFEAGALSKHLGKSKVTPLLFGLKITDLSGPLKQFQAAIFGKSEMLKVIHSINKILPNPLPQKQLENTFDKWWPDLESKVKDILKGIHEEESNDIPPIRSERELLEEILLLTRESLRYARLSNSISPIAIKELLKIYIDIHDQQATSTGSYQDTLDLMKEMHRALYHIAKQYSRSDEEIASLFNKLSELSYTVINKEDSNILGDVDISEEDLPF